MAEGISMYFQSNRQDVQCSKCKKDIKLNFLSSDNGISYEDDPVFSVPENCYIQTGGDYCGGRWMHFFCSPECAKIEKEKI